MANEEKALSAEQMSSVKVVYNEEDDSLLHVIYDGVDTAINFEHIAPYWKNGSRNVISSIRAYVMGVVVLCWACSQNGAVGVIFAWDAKRSKLIHVSEGSFTRKAIISGMFVYSLREVPKPDINELVLCVATGPMLDGDDKKKVKLIPLNLKIFDKTFNFDNYKLYAKDGSVFAGFRNEMRELRIRVEKEMVKAPSKPS